MNTEEELIQIVEYDPSYIQFIKNPSEKVQLAAVNKNGSSIYFIKHPTEKVIQTAIANGAEKENLKFVDINNLSDETKLMIELL